MAIRATYSKWGYGQKKVAAAGTAERITDQEIKTFKVILKGLATNTGIVYFGFDEHLDSTNGFELSAKEEIEIKIDRLDKIWLDVAVSGEGVCYALAVREVI